MGKLRPGWNQLPESRRPPEGTWMLAQRAGFTSLLLKLPHSEIGEFQHPGEILSLSYVYCPK